MNGLGSKGEELFIFRKESMKTVVVATCREGIWDSHANPHHLSLSTVPTALRASDRQLHGQSWVADICP